MTLISWHNGGHQLKRDGLWNVRTFGNIYSFAKITVSDVSFLCCIILYRPYFLKIRFISLSVADRDIEVISSVKSRCQLLSLSTSCDFTGLQSCQAPRLWDSSGRTYGPPFSRHLPRLVTGTAPIARRFLTIFIIRFLLLQDSASSKSYARAKSGGGRAPLCKYPVYGSCEISKA